MFLSKKTVSLVVCFILFFVALQGAAPKFYTSGPDKVMLDGYDVVSYYFNPSPAKGSPDIELDFAGVKWRFMSQANLSRFKKNPGMYIPEFGGYCVWAIAHGRLTGGLPQYWRIVEGRLYLFCSKETISKWMVERELINRLALNNWPQILEKDRSQK